MQLYPQGPRGDYDGFDNFHEAYPTIKVSDNHL